MLMIVLCRIVNVTSSSQLWHKKTILNNFCADDIVKMWEEWAARLRAARTAVSRAARAGVVTLRHATTRHNTNWALATSINFVSIFSNNKLETNYTKWKNSGKRFVESEVGPLWPNNRTTEPPLRSAPPRSRSRSPALMPARLLQKL